MSGEWIEKSDKMACQVGWLFRVGVVNCEQQRKPKNANRNMDSKTLSTDR